MNPDGFWIKEPKICEKSKLVSMITSNKQMCNGHRYRLEIANKLKSKLDLFGRGINNITLKEEGLNDYAFSIAMENDMVDSYFTEKVLDCFATGTIPIYHGTKKITDYFNTDGIIFLDELNIDDLNMDLYYSKLDAVKENFEKVLSMETSEDNIYLKYLIRK